MNGEYIKWGILGPGKIAHKFCQDLIKVEGATITAVGSRSKDRANEFALEYNIPNHFGSYEELVQYSEIDVIYVSTPHNFHCEHTILCLNNGKHVLCEKPMAINRDQLIRMVEAARSNNRFLMEAIWTAFFPSIAKAKELIDDGTIGEIKMIEADFGFTAPIDFSKRLYNADLAGGALLDIGIYPLFLALMLKGNPDRIQSLATMTSTGVDASVGINLAWNDGTIASLNSTILANTPCAAKISGTKGYIHIHRRWHESRKISLYDADGLVDNWTYDDDYHGYKYEIEEVHQCLKENKTESEILSHQFSTDLISTMDEIRRSIGLRYPFE